MAGGETYPSPEAAWSAWGEGGERLARLEWWSRPCSRRFPKEWHVGVCGGGPVLGATHLTDIMARARLRAAYAYQCETDLNGSRVRSGQALPVMQHTTRLWIIFSDESIGIPAAFKDL